MSEIKLTDEQNGIIDKIDSFLRDRDSSKQWFYFEGLAGVGKSVVLSAVANEWPDATLCAYTGKAASVLTRKSGLEASTIHAFIYQFLGEHKETLKPMFKPAHEDGDLRGRIALVDEVSMLDEWIMRDFLNTGCKIVACGDPGQLPPVKGKRFFQKSDAKLTQIHRQAWDSAIIRQAHSIRGNGYYVPDGVDFQVKQSVSGEEILAAEVILCWRNATRINLNRLVRAWKGLPEGMAKAGEPVMCLKNNKSLGILNGAVYTLLSDHQYGSQVIELVNEFGDEIEVEGAWIEDYEQPLIMQETNPFAWGYVATVHKSQGSQWDKLILVDEYEKNDGRREWAYTGVTRAAKSVIVQRNW